MSVEGGTLLQLSGNLAESNNVQIDQRRPPVLTNSRVIRSGVLNFLEPYRITPLISIYL